MRPFLYIYLFKATNDFEHAHLDRGAFEQSTEAGRSNTDQDGFAKNEMHQLLVNRRVEFYSSLNCLRFNLNSINDWEE